MARPRCSCQSTKDLDAAGTVTDLGPFDRSAWAWMRPSRWPNSIVPAVDGWPRCRLVSVWHPQGAGDAYRQLAGWFACRVRFGALVPAQQRDLCSLLDEMRLVKDPSELDTMRRAAQITLAPISARCSCRRACCAKARTYANTIWTPSCCTSSVAMVRNIRLMVPLLPPAPTPAFCITVPIPRRSAMASWC